MWLPHFVHHNLNFQLCHLWRRLYVPVVCFVWCSSGNGVKWHSYQFIVTGNHIWKNLTVPGQCKDFSLSNLIGISVDYGPKFRIERVSSFEKFHVCTRELACGAHCCLCMNLFLCFGLHCVDWMSVPLDVRLLITKANVWSWICLCLRNKWL